MLCSDGVLSCYHSSSFVRKNFSFSPGSSGKVGMRPFPSYHSDRRKIQLRQATSQMKSPVTRLGMDRQLNFLWNIMRGHNYFHLNVFAAGKEVQCEARTIEVGADGKVSGGLGEHAKRTGCTVCHPDPGREPEGAQQAQKTAIRDQEEAMGWFFRRLGGGVSGGTTRIREDNEKVLIKHGHGY